jgi:hypothetical protein
MEQAAVRTQNFGGIPSGANALPTASAAMLCEIIVAIRLRLGTRN